MGLEINQNRSVHEDWNNFKTKKKNFGIFRRSSIRFQNVQKNVPVKIFVGDLYI